MTPQCKDCIFWEKDSVDFGYCSEIHNALTICIDSHYITEPDSIGTPDTFGCNLFRENKEETDGQP
jgi:hypothetical protein